MNCIQKKSTFDRLRVAFNNEYCRLLVSHGDAAPVQFMLTLETTLGQNIRYFMYKYKIYDYEWYESINVIFTKIDSYVS